MMVGNLVNLCNRPAWRLNDNRYGLVFQVAYEQSAVGGGSPSQPIALGMVMNVLALLIRQPTPVPLSLVLILPVHRV
jgi:hypothetical protein